MVGPLCTRVAVACDRAAQGLTRGPVRALVDEVRRGLDEPLRVAVAGRVNAGKSTIVNALLHQRVAPTDVSECTRLVTWYRYGVPERAEAVGLDGTRESMALREDGSLPSELGTGERDVSHLDVYLANDSLREVVLVDTPGLASTDPERREATQQLLAYDVRSRVAVARADAVVYVLTATVGAEEVDVLTGFRAMTGGLSGSAVNAVGVLNKADLVGGDDPWAAASALAEGYARELRGALATVVPLIGLLAETADTGIMSEALASALRRLAELPEPRRRALLLSADRFLSAEAPVPTDQRAALLAALDLFGVARGMTLVGAGATTPALVEELRTMSGMARLRDLLLTTFSANADALKANAALTALERVVFFPAEDVTERWRHELQDELEDIALDARMHRLNELRALQEWAAGAVDLPADLEDDLRRLACGTTTRTRLAVADEASTEETCAAAVAGVGRWKRFANEGRASPRQRWVADIACRSFELLWAEAARRSHAE